MLKNAVVAVLVCLCLLVASVSQAARWSIWSEFRNNQRWEVLQYYLDLYPYAQPDGDTCGPTIVMQKANFARGVSMSTYVPNSNGTGGTFVDLWGLLLSVMTRDGIRSTTTDELMAMLSTAYNLGLQPTQRVFGFYAHGYRAKAKVLSQAALQVRSASDPVPFAGKTWRNRTNEGSYRGGHWLMVKGIRAAGPYRCHSLGNGIQGCGGEDFRIEGVQVADPTWGSPAYVNLRQWSIDPNRWISPTVLFDRYWLPLGTYPNMKYWVVLNTDARTQLNGGYRTDNTAEPGSNLATFPYGYGDGEGDGDACLDESDPTCMGG